MSENKKKEPLIKGFSSFDAASFFESQKKIQEEQAAEFQAAALALLESSSSSEDEDGLEVNEQNITASPVDKETTTKKKRKKEKKNKKKKQSTKRSKHHHGSSKHENSVDDGSGRRQFEDLVASQGSPAFFFDTKGDSDNIAFGGLYQGNIASYRRHDPIAFSHRVLGTVDDAKKEKNLKKEAQNKKERPVALITRHDLIYQGKQCENHAEEKKEQNAMDGCTDNADNALEVEEDFIPLKKTRASHRDTHQQEHDLNDNKQSTAMGYILQRTKEFNEKLRNDPQDVQSWLDYAEFQEEALSLSSTTATTTTTTTMHEKQRWREKKSKQTSAEKKIAILEKALEHHHNNDRLLLALLHAAEYICDAKELEIRWRYILASCPQSFLLWKEYIFKRKNDFSTFIGPEIGVLYAQAITSLYKESVLALRKRRDHTSDSSDAMKSTIEKAENELVCLILDNISFYLGLGHTEMAVCMIQTLLEYTFFAPQGWPEDVLEMMIEEFWMSGSPMIGSSSSNSVDSSNNININTGWASWVENSTASIKGDGQGGGMENNLDESISIKEGKQHQMEKKNDDGTQRIPLSDQEEVTETKGKFGVWEELMPAIQARFGHALRTTNDDVVDDDKEEEEKVEEEVDDGIDGVHDGDTKPLINPNKVQQQQETEEELMARLRMEIDQALKDAETVTPEVLSSWLRKESMRDAQQWHPDHGTTCINTTAGTIDTMVDNDNKEEEEDSMFKNIQWEDINHLILRIHSNTARERLVFGCLFFLGVDLQYSASTSNPQARHSYTDDIWHVKNHWQGMIDDASKKERADFEELISSLWISEMQDHQGRGNTNSSNISNSNSNNRSTIHEGVWWQEDPTRLPFLLRLLSSLVNGPFKHCFPLVSATLGLATATPCPSTPPPPLPSIHAGIDANKSINWKAARELAKQLLSLQRDNLTLCAAYAEIELKAGSFKAARKVCHACLAQSISSFKNVGTEQELISIPGLSYVILVLAKIETTAAVPPKNRAEMALLTRQDIQNQRCSFFSSIDTLNQASKEGLHAAYHALAFLGSGGLIPYHRDTIPSQHKGSLQLNQEDAILVRRGYQDGMLQMLQHGSNAWQSFDARSFVACAVAFEQVAGVLTTGNAAFGTHSALSLYKQVVATLLAPQKELSLPQPMAIEELVLDYALLALDASRWSAIIPPKTARDILSGLLSDQFPAHPALLCMLCRLEFAGHTIGSLRRDLNIHLTQCIDDEYTWLTLIGVEVACKSPQSAIRALMERAIGQSSAGRRSPLLWRIFLRFEAAKNNNGRNESVHKVFLRAIDACPGSKALWMDGLVLLLRTVESEKGAPAKMKELNDFMTILAEKMLVLRTDLDTVGCFLAT